jgi:hypothetical protein
MRELARLDYASRNRRLSELETQFKVPPPAQ